MTDASVVLMAERPGLPGRMLAVRHELQRLAAVATNPSTRTAIAQVSRELDRASLALHHNHFDEARLRLEMAEESLNSIERALRTGGNGARWQDRTWATNPPALERSQSDWSESG